MEGKVDEKSIMLFLSLFKNLYDNKQQLESLSLIETEVALPPAPLPSLDESLREIDRKKNEFDMDMGFARVDLNSDIIGIDESFLAFDDLEKKKELETTEELETSRRKAVVQRHEDEDAELLEVLVRVSQVQIWIMTISGTTTSSREKKTTRRRARKEKVRRRSAVETTT